MTRTKELPDWLDEGKLPRDLEESLRHFSGTMLYGDAAPPTLYFLTRSGEDQEPGLREVSGFAPALQSEIETQGESQ